jgi:hypothetical protein
VTSDWPLLVGAAAGSCMTLAAVAAEVMEVTNVEVPSIERVPADIVPHSREAKPTKVVLVAPRFISVVPIVTLSLSRLELGIFVFTPHTRVLLTP